MRKIFVVLLSILFFSFQLKAQTLDCKKIKTGTFAMTYLGKKGIIKRYGNTQDEYFNGAKTPSMSFTVKWLTDCSYTLTPTLTTLKLNPEIPKDAIMMVTITKTTSKGYSCSSYFTFDKTKVFKSELTIVK